MAKPTAEPADVHLPPREKRAFNLAKRAAQQALERRTRVLRLVKDAYVKLDEKETAVRRVRDDLRALMRLSGAWARRDYRDLPWRSILYAVAALVYFVNPADLIPDVIAGLGFVDDVAVVAAVVRAIRGDLDRFQQWEEEQDYDALPPAIVGEK